MYRKLRRATGADSGLQLMVLHRVTTAITIPVVAVVAVGVVVTKVKLVKVFVVPT